MIPVVLGLGSNRVFNGKQPVELLGLACLELQKLFNSLSDKKISLSSVYTTKAMYVTDQSDFFNMAVLGYADDSCSPFFLLEEIHKIEAALGRDRSREIRFGPRSIDIDIELFGASAINAPDLEIPHPRLKERSFILTPMLEILPESSDCIKREVFADCLRQLPDQGVHYYMSALEFGQKYSLEAADEYGRNQRN